MEPPFNQIPYDAAHPDDTLVYKGAPTWLASKEDVLSFKVLGLLSRLHLMPEAKRISVSRPLINAAPLYRVLSPEPPYGLFVVFRTKERRHIQAYYAENCRPRALATIDLDVYKQPSLILETVSMECDRIIEVSDEELDALYRIPAASELHRTAPTILNNK
jgi:hypothetical protein